MQLFVPRVTASQSEAWTMSMFHDCIELLTAESLEDFYISDGLKASTFPIEYDRCVAELDTRLATTGSLTVWVLLDLPPSTSALTQTYDYQAILQLLILTFPDIRWITLPIEISKAAGTGALCTALLAGLVAHQLREEMLLDCHGLQNAIKAQCALPQRDLLAVAIDEEESYAYFNAYAAYRFGRRAAIVNTEAILETRLRHINSGLKPNLVMEDLYLNFPDRGAAADWDHATLHMSDLAARDNYFQVMKAAPTRVFVTAGHVQSGRGMAGNETYLEQLENEGRRIVGLYKPLSDLFRFWFEAVTREPPQQLWVSRPWARLRQGVAALAIRRVVSAAARELSQVRFFPHWTVSLSRGLWSRWKPPGKPEETIDIKGHSAPGRLLLVATRLIVRAESLLGQVTSVKAAVRGAVLSTQASELLGGRTPTTAFEALSLKHAFEVLAECQFQGVEGVIDMDDRFKEIRSDAKGIGRWFEPKRGKQSVLNARIKIASRLALILRERNQFDEEQRCLAETRDLYQKLWFARHNWGLRLFQPFVVYINRLLSSVPLFAGCIVGWIVVLAVLYRLVGHGPDWALVPTESTSLCDNEEMLTWPRAFAVSFETFLGLQKTGSCFGWVDAFAMILGFVHLGVFISHLYSSSARR